MIRLLQCLFFLFVSTSKLFGQPACVPTNCCCGGVQEIGVPNGDFEGPPFPPPNNFITYFAGQTFGAWTVEFGSIDHMGINNPGFNDGNPNGPTQHIDLNGNTNAAITNTLTGLTAGYTYTIVLWYAKNPGTPIANCNILVAGGAWLNDTWSATNNGGDMWLEKCFTFIAQGPTAELRFSGTSNIAACGVLLDDITMWECPGDFQAPVVSNPPAPILNFSCPTQVPPPATLNVSDNCSNNPVVTFTENIIPKDCYFTVQRIWEIADECENTTTFTQNIDVQDNQAPVFSTFPSNITVNCSSAAQATYDTWLENYGGAAASDNCDQDLEWIAVPLSPFSQACGVYPVLFRVKDDCFNLSSRTSQFVIVDNLPPTLVQPAMNDTVVCPVSASDSLAQWLASIGGAIAFDSCGTVGWTNNFSGNAGDSVTVVTFTATDNCGNSVSTTASFVQFAANDTITVNNTTCDPQQVGQSVTMVTQGTCTNILITTTSLAPSDSIIISSITCDPAQAGMFIQNLTNQYGCDSVVVTTVALSPTDTSLISLLSCNPNNAGVFTQNLINQFGCDSTVTTTVTFDPSVVDTTILNTITCDLDLTGIFETLYTGTNGCDSLVITFVLPAPSDEVMINATTCNPSQTGSFTQNLTNQFGCDSTVITTITFDPTNIDSTILNGTTCVPAQAGTSQTLLTNSDGCDSLVISIVSLLPSNLPDLSATTCDPAQAGIFTQNLTNQFGCDSTVTTTVTLLPFDVVAISATACDPTQTGIFTQNLTNQFGCDSTVTTTVTLLPSDVVAISATTCDPLQTGIFTQILTNQFGCDSTVTTTVTLLPSDTVALSATTCDPLQTGTFTQNLTNQFGCDSTVTTTITLLPSDAINFSQSTCDPTQAGTLVQNFTNQFGCDSVIITTVTYDPVACAPVGQVTGAPPSCGGATNGSFTITATSGQIPLQFAWSGGNGSIPALNTPVTETGLASGAYLITLTDAFGLSSTLSVTLASLPGLNVTVNAVNIHNGFTIACAGDTDGTVGSFVSGGTAPLSYLWNTGATTATLMDIGPGMYSLTATDINGCTGIGSVEATSPPALSLEVVTDVAMCGDVTLDGQATYSGGVPPLDVFLNNQPQSGGNLALGNGLNTVSVKDVNGCVYDTVLTINLPPVPQVVLPADAVVVLGESINLEALINVAVYDTLIWTPLPDPACAGCPEQVFQPTKSLILEVTLIDTLGCTDTDEMRITVEQRADIFVPNVFSPNDDGREDIFQVNAGSSVVELQEVAIFDRWGDKMYEWKNPLPPNEWPGWDGRTADKDVNPGVLVYYMKVKLADGSIKVIDGDVTLVR